MLWLRFSFAEGLWAPFCGGVSQGGSEKRWEGSTEHLFQQFTYGVWEGVVAEICLPALLHKLVGQGNLAEN